MSRNVILLGLLNKYIIYVQFKAEVSIYSEPFLWQLREKKS